MTSVVASLTIVPLGSFQGANECILSNILEDSTNRYMFRSAQVHAHCVSHSQFVAFLEACCLKLRKAVVEPGTAVGAIAATSIGLLAFDFFCVRNL